MKKILIIARRELGVFFDSLIAYILLIVFLGLSGFFTWITGNGDVFFTGRSLYKAVFYHRFLDALLLYSSPNYAYVGRRKENRYH